MSLVEQLAAEHAAHDPHAFKAQGVGLSKVSAFENQPYAHQDFPLAVYKEIAATKDQPAGQASKIVNNADELAAAKKDGWVEAEGMKPLDTAKPAATGWKPTLKK